MSPLPLQMFPFTDNPYAVLTLIVAPAILTNACSLLSMATGNRLARTIDRSKELTQELRQLEPASDLYGMRLQHLERLERRATLLLNALRMIYTALGSFAAAALVSLLGALLASSRSGHAASLAFTWISIVTGVVAVGALITASVMLVAETRLTVQSVREELALVRERMSAQRSR